MAAGNSISGAKFMPVPPEIALTNQIRTADWTVSLHRSLSISSTTLPVMVLRRRSFKLLHILVRRFNAKETSLADPILVLLWYYGWSASTAASASFLSNIASGESRSAYPSIMIEANVTRHSTMTVPPIVTSSALRRLSKEIHLRIFLDVISFHTRAAIARCNRLYMKKHTKRSSRSMPHHSFFLFTPVQLLGAVCRDWHRICCNSPILWTHLVIPFIGDFGDSAATVMTKYIHLYTRRSQSCLLNVYMYALDGPVMSCTESPLYENVCSALRSHGERFRFVSVLQHSYGLCPTSPLSDLYCPNLLSFHTTDIAYADRAHLALLRWHLCNDVTIDVHAHRNIPLPFFNLPALATLHIRLRDDPVWPTNALTKNLVDGDTLLYLLRWLQTCDTVQDLTISLPPGHDDDSWDWHPEETPDIHDVLLRLPRLRALRLKGYRREGPSFRPILTACEFSGLRLFSMDQPIPDIFASVVDRWGCDINVLAVTVDPLQPLYRLPDDLVLITPSVVTLSISSWGAYRTYGVMDHLYCTSVYPNLTSIRFDIRYTNGHPEVLRPTATDSMAGFDYGTRLVELLNKRKTIRKVAAVVTYPSDIIQDLKEGLDLLKIEYDVVAYSEDVAVILRNGCKPTSIDLTKTTVPPLHDIQTMHR